MFKNNIFSDKPHPFFQLPNAIIVANAALSFYIYYRPRGINRPESIRVPGPSAVDQGTGAMQGEGPEITELGRLHPQQFTESTGKVPTKVRVLDWRH